MAVGKVLTVAAFMIVIYLLLGVNQNDARQFSGPPSASNTVQPKEPPKTKMKLSADTDSSPNTRTRELAEPTSRNEWYGIVRNVMMNNPTERELEDIISYIRRYDAPDDAQETILAEKIMSILQFAHLGGDRALKYIVDIYPETSIDLFAEDWILHHKSTGVPMDLEKVLMRSKAYFVLALIGTPETDNTLVREYEEYKSKFLSEREDSNLKVDPTGEIYFTLQQAMGLADMREELGREAVIYRLFSAEYNDLILEASLNH